MEEIWGIIMDGGGSGAGLSDGSINHHPPNPPNPPHHPNMARALSSAFASASISPVVL
jgi:hypothetical protein